MAFREPNPAWGAIEGVRTQDRAQVLLDKDGATVEVESLSGIGFSIEVRHDKQSPDIRRQPFTGVQEQCEREVLTLSEDEQKITLQGNESVIRFERETGRFEIAVEGDIVLRTAIHPFTCHKEPIELYEGILSLKYTDFTDRWPFTTQPNTFPSRMVRFQYERTEGPVLGLPGQTGEFNRNGYRFELYNTDETLHIPSRRPLYQSWPILFHRSPSQAYWVAVFHDNPSRTFVDIGDFYPQLVTFESLTGNSRVYVLPGKTLSEVSRKLSRLLGRPLLPPAWAFGYQQCRWYYSSTEEMRKIVKNFADAGFPLDAMYFDINYMDGYRVFTIDTTHFGDTPEYIRQANEQGIRSVGIVDPGVKTDGNFPLYNQVRETGAYLKTQLGEPLPAAVWPGEALLPDFQSEKIQSLWSDAQARWLQETGLDGVWNDMNEPSNFTGGNPATAKSHTERGSFTIDSNLYGYSMAKASKRGWDKVKGKERPFIITRSGYPGVQQYAIVWHGDNQSWWEHLRLALDTCIQYSIAGVHYTGPDVPGFVGNPSDDLAVRFFQLGAFMPFFRGHSIFYNKDKEPYVFSDPARTYIKQAINLRYSLLREWYSGFEHAWRTQTPPILPTFDPEGDLVRDQMLLWNKFLVAPVIERGAKYRTIYLPEGTWYRFGNMEMTVEGGRYFIDKVTLADIPLYVRAGSIVVRNTPGKNVQETFKNPEIHEIYPDPQGKAEGYWFGDDGVSVEDPKAERYLLSWDAQKKQVERNKY